MVRHSPGEWYGLVTPSGVALLPPEVPIATVEQVWRDLGAGRGLSAVIDGLVGVFGMSLGGLPPFGVISLEESGGVRAALRGDLRAQLWLRGATEPVTVSGAGVTTWNEQAFGEADRAELALPGGREDAGLPVENGVVWAGRLSLEILASEGGDPSVRILPRWVAEPPASAVTAFEVPPVGDDDAVEVSVPVSEPESASVPQPQTEPVLAPEPDPATAPEAPPAPVSEPVDDSTGGVGPEPEPAPAPDRAAETLVAEEAPNEYDRLLFGETVLSSVEAAAVRAEEPELTTAGVEPLDTPAATLPPAASVPPVAPVPPPPPPLQGGLIGGLPSFGAPPPPPPPAVTPAALGDHDGETVLVQDLQHVLGIQWNQPVQQSPAAVRPIPKLLISGMEPITLDRTAIVGTRPRLTRVQGDNAPQVIPVESPSGEISRNHVEIRVEGTTVLGVDLNSTNGTMLRRVGADPVRLQPNEPNILVPGDRLDLGDGVVLEFEGLA